MDSNQEPDKVLDILLRLWCLHTLANSIPQFEEPESIYIRPDKHPRPAESQLYPGRWDCLDNRRCLGRFDDKQVDS